MLISTAGYLDFLLSDNTNQIPLLLKSYFKIIILKQRLYEGFCNTDARIIRVGKRNTPKERHFNMHDPLCSLLYCLYYKYCTALLHIIICIVCIKCFVDKISLEFEYANFFANEKAQLITIISCC